MNGEKGRITNKDDGTEECGYVVVKEGRRDRVVGVVVYAARPGIMQGPVRW
jgi:hypothetical protein